MGGLFFSIKFFRNLYNLFQKIQQNPKYQNSSFINILLNETIIPHTFFNYIFLNKTQFESNEIPDEVMLHEEAHARQKHSLDLVFIEILQIVFWFNPLFYFLKRSIKLNHEFLADRTILNAGTETSGYQRILLAFSSPDSYRDAYTPSLAHSINYSSIKKRFTVMKTRTSKRAILLRSILLLPLLAILIYGFSTTQEISQVTRNSEKVLKDTSSIQKITLKVSHNKITFEKAKNLIKNNPSISIATQNSGLPNAITTISKSPINFESIKQKATKAELAEYNKLAIKYTHSI